MHVHDATAARARHGMCMCTRTRTWSCISPRGHDARHTPQAILELYAKHLEAGQRSELAAAAVGASGRDLRDVCEAAERRWAARRVRKEAAAAARLLPPAEEYKAALAERLASAPASAATHASAALRPPRALA